MLYFSRGSQVEKLAKKAGGNISSDEVQISKNRAVLRGRDKLKEKIKNLKKEERLSAIRQHLLRFSIKINPKNKGKFDATEKRTGETVGELANSKNPLTRKRAIFAENAKKLHHLSAVRKHLIQFSDPRPRNTLGEFSGNQEEGPNPEAMAKTYRQGLIKGTAEAVGAGAAGAAGAALYKKTTKALKRARR